MRPGSALRLAILALLWGSSFLWIKVALEGLSPVQITLIRLALGAAVLLVIVRASRLRLPSSRRIWRHLALAAFFGNAIPYFLFGLGEESVDSSVAGALNATTPLWTIAIALAVRQETALGLRRTAGVLLGFAGSLLIFAPWEAGLSESLGGALACLGASASYGISYVYMGRYLTGRGIPPLVLSAAQLTAATGWLILATPIAGLQPIHLTATVVVSILVLGAAGTGIAYVLNYRLIADEGPTAASTVTYLLPIVAVALGAAVLDEPLTARLVMGTAVVLAGVALAQRRRPAREPETAP
jgi:drug/metabolite transporter (DMT)-like permease